MTQTSRKPFSRNRLTMWAGSATVTAISSTTNTPISKNGALKMKSVTPLTACGSAAATRGPGRGAPRSVSQCRGAHTSRCSAARAMNAWRQPHSAISQAVSGMNTVLARPPKKVMRMMARRKSFGKRRVTTAKAGAYKVAAIAAPRPAQTA